MQGRTMVALLLELNRRPAGLKALDLAILILKSFPKTNNQSLDFETLAGKCKSAVKRVETILIANGTLKSSQTILLSATTESQNLSF